MVAQPCQCQIKIYVQHSWLSYKAHQRWLGQVVRKCACLEETLADLVEKDEVGVKSEGMVNVMT